MSADMSTGLSHHGDQPSTIDYLVPSQFSELGLMRLPKTRLIRAGRCLVQIPHPLVNGITFFLHSRGRFPGTQRSHGESRRIRQPGTDYRERPTKHVVDQVEIDAEFVLCHGSRRGRRREYEWDDYV